MNKDFIYKKSLGQNFLNNEKIIEKISSSINPKEDDLIIEIGPGSGALTKKLKQYNSNLYCFEIDKRLEETLLKLENNKTHIIFKDFLKVDLQEFLKEKKYNNLYVVGNIPYYITTPIIKKITLETNASEVILMIQKEVATRYMASPNTKEYGSISVFLNYNYNVSIVTNVNKKYFTPVPKVDSSVIKITRINKEKVKNEELFYKFIKNCFLQKRKTLKNNLKEYNFNIINEYLTEINKSENTRAEQLTLDDFINIFNRIN